MLTIDANVWIAAADSSDVFYTVSRTFLIAVARQQLLANALLTSVYIVHVPLDTQLLSRALLTGTSAFLRGADSLYVATAQLHQTTLVSWDDELVRRANAVIPSEWLATHSS